MLYDGFRFRATCRLAGKNYGQPFGVDVAFGDPIFGEPEVVVAEDTLSFAGISPPTLRVYPIETHIAEKLHAYTMPRSRPNSRVKDLPDIALLATAQPIDARRLRAALDQTFAFRQVTAAARTFLDPVLAPDFEAEWDPRIWALESDRCDLHTVPGATLSDLDFPLFLRVVLPATVASEPAIEPEEFRAKVDEASKTPAP